MTKSIVTKEVESFKFATDGIKHAFKTQNNFKIQLAVGILAVSFAVSFGFNRLEWIILLFLICLVLAAELINTAVETIVDLHTSQYHPKAKIAKDLSAAFVLLISVFVSLIGILLFIPHFLATLGL